MRRVSTVVGQLFVEEWGTGPAVIFWHSLLCDGTMWRRLIVPLKRHYRLLLVDGPGHGRSEGPHHAFPLDDCADAAVQILDSFRVDRATFVGLSWGGMTAMRAALRAPERTRALALFDTSADREGVFNRFRYRVMAAVFRRWGLIPLLVPRVLALMFSGNTLRSRPELAYDLVTKVRSWKRGELGLAIEAVALKRRSIVDQLSRIHVPTLVVVGEEDRATPPSVNARIACAIHGASFARIPEAGHLTVLEAPEAVATMLEGFLARVHS
jgi:pimeloyl-ACP methyl ester carboxylesterase